jgi:hypothetical protein
MNDVATLLQIVLSLAVVTLPVILVVLVIAGSRRASLFDLIVLSPPELPWPNGVQEEDCPRWAVERLEARAHRPESSPERCPKPAEPVRGRKVGSTSPSRAS